ncbi:hypothetical protein SLEP1_g8134 [Rubroshorea leprosula]|uniref:Uncharacterized protein n=2 Tax=Rubroshorea leprosula TaxID=152421 RepID=A0AAV5I9S0_9ROSI|nr:hypothetical protein SLEP1_g8134 [Rubroshorea leprosula]
MVSDSELIARLREFLRESDLNTTTTAIVRRKLEEDFGVDLSEKKKFIREQVDLYLQTQVENAEEEEQEEEEEEEDGDQIEKVKSEESGGSDATYNGVDAGDNEGTNKGKRSSKKRSKERNHEVKRKAGGFCKLSSLSPQLQDLLGVPALARTEVVKQIWAYIREKNLQDPANKKTIICDEPLRALFGVQSIDMFQMNKALSKHIWPLDSDDVGPVKSTEKERQHKQEREEDSESCFSTSSHLHIKDFLVLYVHTLRGYSDEPKRKEKRQKGESTEKGKSGFLAPLQLSDALVKFLGTGESALSRANVIKRMWDYIKENNLQDPSDKRRVICDEKLKELFDVDSFNGFTVSKLLAIHFVKS